MNHFLSLNLVFLGLLPDSAKIPSPSNNAPVKPAGQDADWRSVGAMVALRHLSTTCLAFEDASAVWCTAALQMGLVFQGKALDGSSGKIYLSLGFHFAAALLWEIQEVQDGIFEVAPSSSLGIAECRERVHFVCLTRLDKAGNGEDFGGIPTTI